MAKFINMVNDTIPGRIVLVSEQAFTKVWSKKGWERYEVPSIATPDDAGEPRDFAKPKSKNPAKKKLSSSPQVEETT